MHSLIHSLLSSYLQAHPKIAIFILSLWTVYSVPTPTLSILNKGYEQQVHVLPQKQKYSVPSENQNNVICDQTVQATLGVVESHLYNIIIIFTIFYFFGILPMLTLLTVFKINGHDM